jgi:hypothetical protein
MAESPEQAEAKAEALGGLQRWVVGVVSGVIANPQVQQTVENLLGKLITERIVPLIPLAVASATKAITEAIPNIATASIEHVSETIRTDLNNAIPDFDLGIPAIDNLLDFWRPKHG